MAPWATRVTESNSSCYAEMQQGKLKIKGVLSLNNNLSICALKPGLRREDERKRPNKISN
jgi:hypothetical protein